MATESTYIDELTGVHNRRYLNEVGKDEINSFINKNIPFSVVWIDIDHFKEINDTYGHLKGDEIIRAFATFLRNSLRTGDKVIRYGGDEFVCIMPTTRRTDAEAIYWRILKRLKEKNFTGLEITISAGISSFPDDAKDFQKLLEMADQALYDAKRSGRDRIGVIRKKIIELPMKVFVNRIEEKERLKTLLADSERMKAAVVKGLTGVGKTRLVRELLSALKGREIVWTDCLFITKDVAYYPIREAVKYRLGRLDAEILKSIPVVYKREIGKLIPEIATEPGSKPSGAVAVDKYRFYEGIKELIEIGQREKLVVIDNLQWIDRESTEVIKYLMRSLQDKPISFLFIYRTEERSNSLEEFLSYISRETEVGELEVAPLEYSGIKECVKSIIGEEPESELVEYVVRESGGIPLFIEEIVRELAQQEYLVVKDERWVFRPPETEFVPKTLEDIVLQKYGRLSKEAQHVAGVASAIGTFDVDIIREVTKYNEGEVIGLINDIGKSGIARYARDKVAFSDMVSRDAIYRMFIERAHSTDIHRDIGAMIEKKNATNIESVVKELAYHYYRCRDITLGVEYCIKAGDMAMEEHAYGNAARYYTWSLDLLQAEQGGTTAQTRIDCMCKRADSSVATSDYDSAIRFLEQGQTEAQTIRDTTREVSIMMRKVGIYQHRAQYQTALTEAGKCRDLYAQMGDNEGLGHALTTIAHNHFLLHEREKAQRFLEEALGLFVKIGNKNGEKNVLASLAALYADSGDAPQSLSMSQRALEIHRALSDTRGAATMLNNIGVLYGETSEYDKARQCYNDAIKVCHEEGRGTRHAVPYYTTVYLYHLLGDYGKILTGCGDFSNRSDSVWDRCCEAVCRGNMGALHAKLCEYREALKSQEQALELHRILHDRSGEAIGLANIGFVNARLGEYQDALRCTKEALDIARDMKDKNVEAFCLTVLGTMYLDLGDYVLARNFLDNAQNIIEHLNIDWLTFANCIAFGKFYVTQNQGDKAQPYIDCAVKMAEQSGSALMSLEVMSLLCFLYLGAQEYDLFDATMKRIPAQAVDKGTQHHAAVFHFLVGRYHLQKKNYEQAQSSFAQASGIFERLGEKLNIGQTHYYRALTEMQASGRIVTKSYLDSSLQIFASIGAKDWKEKVEKTLSFPL